VSFRALDADIEWPNGERLSAASLEAAGGADIGGGAWRLSGEVNLHRPVLRDSSGGAWLAAERLGALDAVAALRRSGTDAARSLRLASPAWIGTLSLTGLRAAIVLDGASGAPDNRPLDAALALLGGTRPNAAATAVVDDPRDLAPRVAAGRLELEAGALEIVDASLGDVRPSFDVLDVVGALERTGTEPAAVVADLAGRVGEEGAARVRFRAELGEPGSRDVDIELGAVPARLFTEHARRLAGYLLEDGTIDAAIDYRVDADGSVEGEARVGGRGLVIEHTEEAADDPSVALALALLEDQHGVAETTYRFRSPNDGRERIDRIVAASIVTQLETVAAAPFAALGTAAGVDASALDTVSFRPGEAEPAEPETLAALADALLARPAVGLRVQGVADRVLDRDALAAQQIELHVTLATAGPTQVARPRPVDFASPRHRDVLDEFAGERLSAEERETIASYFGRTPDGRIVEGERSAYYRALFEALVENETIPENGIERLGRYRARAIANALAAHGVPEQRIEILPAVVQAGASDSAIEVPLAVFALSTRPAPDLAAR